MVFHSGKLVENLCVRPETTGDAYPEFWNGRGRGAAGAEGGEWGGDRPTRSHYLPFPLPTGTVISRGTRPPVFTPILVRSFEFDDGSMIDHVLGGYLLVKLS